MEVIAEELKKFSEFILSKTYGTSPVVDPSILMQSFNQVVKDVNYHYPARIENEILNDVISGKNELLIWLYRWGRFTFLNDKNNPILLRIHWLMKETCAAEIYFSTAIDSGLYIFHGEGLVIGSRSVIGRGLRIYQGVTIGHKEKNKPGPTIGTDVSIYSGARILGDIQIGNNVIVGANTVVTSSIPDQSIVFGNPNKVKRNAGNNTLI